MVIVESPSKAKIIQSFLDSLYVVESCMGHVRDLPQSAKSVPPELKARFGKVVGVDPDNHFEPLYVTLPGKESVIKKLEGIQRKAKEVILATDEDREGEAISWHLLELLKPKVPVKRAVFHEITKDAITRSFQSLRSIDLNLVHAQETRRILDRLAGFTMSPLLWKKIARGLSAGRVQSVGMAIIVRRELERLSFVPAAYFDLRANLSAVEGSDARHFSAMVVEVEGKGKVATGRDFDAKGQLHESSGRGKLIHLDKESANSLMEGLKQQGASWKVKKVEKRAQRRKPPPPFITSTLQQEANRKLSLSSKECMRTAQRLYESGLITYMRTDNPILSDSALTIAIKRAAELFGPDAVQPADAARKNIKKPKGSQEAHEPIRPERRRGDQTAAGLRLTTAQAELYELIFQRTLASVMCDAELDLTSPADRSRDSAIFRASGRVIRKHGWMLAYLDSSDEQQVDSQRLPSLLTNQELLCSELKVDEHSTKPPARYTEASLVKELEELGVGRPSTYTQIIETLKDREYVTMDGKALSPTLIAFVVTRLLETYFQDFVDTSFTARMEEELDRIARGEMKKEEYLSRYYLGDDGLRNKVEISESRIIPEEARQVKLPTLEFQVLVGSYGAYVQARRKEEGKEDSEGGEGKEETQHNLVKANIPQTFCKDVNQLTPERIRKCLETKQPILLRVGPYGLYLQKGEGEAEGKTAKKVALPQDMDPQGISLETAKAYLNLPRVICDHPETGSAIQVGIGRYGTFLLYQGSYRSLPATDDIFTLDCSRAVEIINSAAVSPRSTRVIAELGEYERRRVAVVQGRFGPYIKCGLVNAKLPEHHKDSPGFNCLPHPPHLTHEKEDCTLEEAIESIKLKSPQKGKSTPKKKVFTPPPPPACLLPRNR
uniref:DNA topoisomerase n=2 Tax=Guillardia theta TaxID=55529 RepID=A0A0C3UB14_GUITC